MAQKQQKVVHQLWNERNKVPSAWTYNFGWVLCFHARMSLAKAQGPKLNPNSLHHKSKPRYYLRGLFVLVLKSGLLKKIQVRTYISKAKGGHGQNLGW